MRQWRRWRTRCLRTKRRRGHSLIEELPPYASASVIAFLTLHFPWQLLTRQLSWNPNIPHTTFSDDNSTVNFIYILNHFKTSSGCRRTLTISNKCHDQETTNDDNRFNDSLSDKSGGSDGKSAITMTERSRQKCTIKLYKCTKYERGKEEGEWKSCTGNPPSVSTTCY